MLQIRLLYKQKYGLPHRFRFIRGKGHVGDGGVINERLESAIGSIIEPL